MSDHFRAAKRRVRNRVRLWANHTRFPWLNRFLNRLLWGPPDETPAIYIEPPMEVGETRDLLNTYEWET